MNKNILSGNTTVHFNGEKTSLQRFVLDNDYDVVTNYINRIYLDYNYHVSDNVKTFLSNYTTVTFTERFLDKLSKVDHIYARKLDNMIYEANKTFCVNVDYEDNLIRYDEFLGTPNQKMKIGKWVAKLFRMNGYECDNKLLESFVNKFKEEKDFHFEILKGADILEAYNTKNYFILNSGTLSKSCMNNKLELVDWYAIQPSIRCLVYKENKSNKIIGRAILWEKVNMSGKVMKLMDRVYVNADFHIEIFSKWAKENGYLQRADNNNRLLGNFRYKKIDLFVKPNGEEVKALPSYIEERFGVDDVPYFDTVTAYRRQGSKLIELENDYWL